MQRTDQKKSSYLPTLDGWRAIAISAVILHHDAIHTLGPLNTRWIQEYGDSGVDVFFAISGFLICSRLLDEQRLDGTIHLTRFYVRRFFRILPPAILYLAVIGILSAFAMLPVSWPECVESILFCRNYPTVFAFLHKDPGWYTSHFWSLSIEEQFYLLLPALLLLTRKRFRVPALVIIAFGIAIHRWIALHSTPWMSIGFHAGVRLDALLIPALFAVLAAKPQAREYLRTGLRFWPLFGLAILCILPFGRGTAWHVTVLNILMPCLVVGSVLNPNNLFGQILELPFLKWFGRISYSLYLWQQLFFNQHFLPGNRPLGLLQTWPINLFLTFACALGSYYLVERPLARIGHKLAPSATPGRNDLDEKTSVIEARA